MTGTRDRPYVLRLPAALYRTHGPQFGCDFTGDEIRHASASGQALGVRRYLPSGELPVRFPIPKGAFVECRVSERVA